MIKSHQRTIIPVDSMLKGSLQINWIKDKWREIPQNNKRINFNYR